MPLYAAWLGAREADVGFIIGVFALAAMVVRPLAGDLADRIGRRPLVLLGTAIFALAPLGYLAIGTIPGLLLLRAFHGTGMGFGPTAATVIATDLTAPERRGAAMGAYGLASAVALAVGPYLGAELVRGAGFSVTFLVATAIEIAALALAWGLPETRPVTGSPPAAAPASGAPASSAGRLCPVLAPLVQPGGDLPVGARPGPLCFVWRHRRAPAPLRRAASAGEPGTLLHGVCPGEPGRAIPGGAALGPLRPTDRDRAGPRPQRGESRPARHGLLARDVPRRSRRSTASALARGSPRSWR